MATKQLLAAMCMTGGILLAYKSGRMSGQTEQREMVNECRRASYAFIDCADRHVTLDQRQDMFQCVDTVVPEDDARPLIDQPWAAVEHPRRAPAEAVAQASPEDSENVF